MAERLTDRGIAALKTADKPYLVFDTEVSGLALKIYETGRKAFVFDWRENGKQRRKTIGQYPAWTIGKARTHASRMRLKADTGEAVAPGRGGRVADLIEQWRAVVKLTRRPGTAAGYCHMIDNHVLPAFGKFEPRAITRNSVEAWHGEMAQRTPINANRALGVLSAFLSWLEHDHKIERNPCRGVRRRPENQRQVFLDADEIAAAHVALAGVNKRAAALAIRLALLTGARIGETLSLAADQLNAKRRIWIKPAAHTKQKRLHIVPLQPEALSVAQELLRIGLPNYEDCRRAWRRTKAIIGRPDVRIHDLRHSRASALARGGASLMQIGKVLGHTAPATTARYSHLVDRDLVDLIERS
jgi:integrase